MPSRAAAARGAAGCLCDCAQRDKAFQYRHFFLQVLLVLEHEVVGHPDGIQPGLLARMHDCQQGIEAVAVLTWVARPKLKT
jgi:hypothetical protein